MYLNQRIEELIAKYPDARSSVGKVILDQMESIPDMSIQQLADLACVSKATIVRFAKSLGFEGWKEFRRELMAEIARQKNNGTSLDVNYPFQSGQSDEQIIRSIEQLRIQTLERTRALLNVDMVGRVVNLMVRAGRIIIFCVSPHVYSAGLFARKMMTIQKPVTVCPAREMGITARTMSSRDLAIIISYAGNNPDSEPMRVSRYLLDHKIPAAVITSQGKNYLHDLFSNVLEIPADEHLYTKIATFSTEEAVGFLLDVLFACFFARSYEEHNASKIQSAAFLESRRSSQAHIPQ